MEIFIRLLTIMISLILTYSGFREAKDKNIAGVVWVASLLAIIQFQGAAGL